MNRRSPRHASRLLAALVLVASLIAVPLAALGGETDPVASISLSVLPDTPDGTAQYDTMLRYVFTVTNTGQVVLTDVVLTDTLCGDVGTAATLTPGSSLEFEGWARVESGEGVATVRALAPGSIEASATAAHAIEPYISHEWPEDGSADPDPGVEAEHAAAPVALPAVGAAATTEPYLPFTGEHPAPQVAVAAGFAFLGVALRRRGRVI